MRLITTATAFRLDDAPFRVHFTSIHHEQNAEIDFAGITRRSGGVLEDAGSSSSSAHGADAIAAAIHTVGELAEACEIASHMASEHLRLLQRCGFLSSTKEGRFFYYQVNTAHAK